MNIGELRQDYKKETLDEKDVNQNPIEQFKLWFNEAIISKLLEPNAFCLSTIHNNSPESRIVLLKEINDNGFVFFTNYNSAKGKQISINNNVSLNFLWLELERQVRIEGVAEKISALESDIYFYSRPIGSQIGAIVSEQSEIIESRSILEEALNIAEQKYKIEKPIRPEHWGGYIVKPRLIEFWQGRSSRLHDRISFELVDGSWMISRLSP
ncbi:MAG: pyridoxamine 5'-phosphate oxidase [Bacteroidetes bacterium]|nr:pyridoxamine 5'-phosphate oxidase [Bacteroidota bacterium]